MTQLSVVFNKGQFVQGVLFKTWPIILIHPCRTPTDVILWQGTMICEVLVFYIQQNIFGNNIIIFVIPTFCLWKMFLYKFDVSSFEFVNKVALQAARSKQVWYSTLDCIQGDIFYSIHKNMERIFAFGDICEVLVNFYCNDINSW